MRSRSAMVEAFTKKASVLLKEAGFRPPSLSDASKVTNRMVPKVPQTISQPAPASPPAAPSFAQKQTPPPPVQ
jgi:hypothetical protein